jgi:hypothetical protein
MTGRCAVCVVTNGCARSHPPPACFLVYANGAGDGQRREAPQLGGCETPGSAREGGLHVQVLLQAAIMDQSRMVAEVLGGSGF